MATQDSTLSSLTMIRTKVRRLTRSPSTSQITNDQLDEYINTFILYDFPEIKLTKKFSFYTIPNVDTYDTNTTNATDPLYNFKNKYVNIMAPVYIEGSVGAVVKSWETMNDMFSSLTYEENIGTGDDSTVLFSGTFSHFPVLANSVTVSSVDADGKPILLKDNPDYDGTTGFQLQTGDFVVPNDTADKGDINYLTGVYSITFDTAPGSGEPVVSKVFYYAAGKPTAVLFTENKMIVRPVPDKTYRIDIMAVQRPTELLDVAETTELGQYWQYIAYGAAKKIFEDRMDMASVEAIMPEFERQRCLVLERQARNRTDQRAATIYCCEGASYVKYE